MTGILNLTLLSTCFLHVWFCFENELVIWLSETGQRDSFCKSVIRNNKAEKITALGTVLPYCVVYYMEERCLKNTRDPTIMFEVLANTLRNFNILTHAFTIATEIKCQQAALRRTDGGKGEFKLLPIHRIMLLTSNAVLLFVGSKILIQQRI